MIYAAILSDKAIYECNVKRLLERGSNLAGIYSGKIDLMELNTCSSRIEKQDLGLFGSLLTNDDLGELNGLADYAEDLEEKNDRSVCELW